MSTKPTRAGRIVGWCRTPEAWCLLAAVVLPLGWVVPLCRFAWVRVTTNANRERNR